MFILRLDQVGTEDLAAVGGKARNLGRLAKHGFPVPPGFVITTEAYRRRDDPEVAAAITAAYDRFGGRVAVRSSATVEDLDEASFAGQQESILGVTGREAVLQAVRHCWDSLHSERAVAYRRASAVDHDGLSMAVIVQRLVEADVAGVLFTRDPAGDSNRVVVEAAWGLGCGVVSGRVNPDRWTLDPESGDPVRSEIARKPVMFTAAGEAPVPTGRQSLPSLSMEQLGRLAELGREVEALFGEPQDVEWAFAGGDLFVLQSRPITVTGGEREQVRREEIAYLRERAAPGGTVWARYSLAEVLPEPLPMTWALWKRFMSGGGGYGKMYRELGYDPDPCLETDGVLDLIAGRPYFNLSRDARLYFRDFPFDYPFAKLKANPELAIYPRPEPNLTRAGKGFLWRLPCVAWRMRAAQKRLDRAAEELPDRLEREVFPRIAAFASDLRQFDLAAQPEQDLLIAFHDACRAVFEEYAPRGLQAGVLAGLAIRELESLLVTGDGSTECPELETLLAGAALPPEYDLAGALRRLGAGVLTPADFLEGFGHRGPGEMELASPRWRELGVSGLSGAAVPEAASRPPGVSSEDVARTQRAVTHPRAKRVLERARRFIGLREAAKHYLMLGYEGIRLVLVELDRRYGLHGGVFYLEPDELADLVGGHDFRPLIARRRRRRALALGLEAPRVLFSDDLEALGRSTVIPASREAIRGTGVSGGVAEASALVLRDPEAAPPDLHGFVLVCPSTDPGWVPLFLRARGVVMETGGILSHGAIVARELGLPAVVNIPDACARLQTGQRLRVDGTDGIVHVL